jgi:hypothetical protein
MFENFLKKIGKFFSNESKQQTLVTSNVYNSGNHNNDKKKFIVKENNRKKFLVKGTMDISPQSSSSSSGKLKNMSQTRPKKCPYCRTEDKITKTPEKKWKCKACEYEW